MRSLGWLLAFTVLVSACGESQGTVSVVFQWPGQPPANLPSQIFGRIRVFSADGSVVTTADTMPGQTTADLTPIPNGTGYTIKVELLATSGPEAQVLYYGISAPFSIKPGERSTVSVAVPMRSVPSLAPGAVQIESIGGTTATPLVTLDLLTDTGVSVTVSNDPGLTAGVSTMRFALTTPATALTAPPGFSAYSVSWNLNAGGSDCTVPAGCTRAVYVQFSDANGETSPFASATVLLDDAPPGIALAQVGYTPPAGSILSNVQAASSGTTIAVSVHPDKPIATTPPPTLTATSGSLSIPFVLDNTSLTSSSATFLAAVSSATTDGTYVPSITWTDALTKVTSTASFTTPPIAVLTSTPVLTIDQAQTIYVRSPWGNTTSESFGAVTVPAGPWFAVAPTNFLAGVATMSATTFAGTATAAEIRIWSDQSKTALLGAAVPAGNGDWPLVTLLPDDLPDVSITLVDIAGNESTPVPVENVEWVATPTPVNGTSPHTVSAGNCYPPRALGASAIPVTAAAAGIWNEVTPSGSMPQVAYLAMASDTVHGTVLAYGGSAANDLYETNFVWDGVTWRTVGLGDVGPEARIDHAMAEDIGRGRLVLFGGQNENGTSLNDTWLWDGAAWTQVTPVQSPPPRIWPAMAYDPLRARTVLFGGYGSADLNDTWEWDGASWTQITPTGAAPSARDNMMMAFDAVNGQTMLFGGNDESGTTLNDTWEWNGVTWTLLTPAQSPPARFSGVMAWDTARNRMVLFGGTPLSTNVLGDTWEWDGTDWMLVADAARGPGARAHLGGAYDSVHQVVTIAGGRNGNQVGLSDTWSWNGSTWTQVDQEDLSQGPIYGASMTYDSANHVSWLFGGSNGPDALTGTWSWDGTSWAEYSSLISPGGRLYAGMDYDQSRQRTVLFGGETLAGQLGDTWEWNGVAWTAFTPTNPPTARDGPSMVYDDDAQVSLLFGGATSVLMNDLWSWNGTAWVNLTPTTPSPPARLAAALTYDSGRHRAVLFGGLTESGAVNNTWEWDGTAWHQMTPVGASPPARSGHAAVYDSVLGLTLMWGGQDVLGDAFADLWTWNGVSWTDVTPLGGNPPGRAEHVMAYDAARERLVIAGGWNGVQGLSDTWEWSLPTTCRPAAEVDVAGSLGGFALSAVTGLRVRAVCGGTDGAQLWGWDTLGPATLGGPFKMLGSQPQATPSLIDWSAASAGDAQSYLLTDDELSFQCRPPETTAFGESDAGLPDVTDGGTAVSLNYLEARVRYEAGD